MIREGTRGAEGKNKGIERKEPERAKRRKRQKIESLRSQARWAKYKKIKPCPRRVHEEIRSAHRNVLVIPSARTLREIIYSKRNSKRKTREGSTDVYLLKRTIDLHKCRNSADSTIGEDRHKPAFVDTFRAKEDKIFSSKRNLKRKSRGGSTGVYLLKRTIELHVETD